MIGVKSTHRTMKNKKTKPTIRSISIQLDELRAVITRQEGWIQYLRNNNDLVSEMLYGHMKVNGNLEKVIEYIEKDKEKNAKQEQSKRK